MIQMGENPWQVHSIQAFSYLKCPECTFDTKKEDTFQDHATQNHPLSYVLFTKTIKKENFEDPLTLEITSDDMMPDLIENFKSDNIFPTLEPDEKYIVKTEVSEEQNFEPFDEFKIKSEKPYECTECEKNFKLKKSLKKHFSRAHSDKDFVELAVKQEYKEDQGNLLWSIDNKTVKT